MTDPSRLTIVTAGAGVFGPLASLRSVADVRTGAFTLRQRWLTAARLANPRLELTFSDAEPSDSGALQLQTLVEVDSLDRLFHEPKRENLPPIYPWDVLNNLGRQIAADLALAERLNAGSLAQLPTDAIVRGIDEVRLNGFIRVGPGAIIDASRARIRIEDGAEIGAGAILATEKDAPIWIGKHARVMPGAIITGPAYIGDGSIVRQGARINGDVALGPHCRVGGELSSVVMQGFSNKQHSGYLGGVMVGEFVNLGAATDNSDLKNNYRPIEVTLDEEPLASGELHFGGVIGDFVRTAIHTRLNTGTVVGVSCNLFGADFPDKAIPPFIWFDGNGYQEYRLDKALETVEVILSRRQKVLDDHLRNALTDLFASTAGRRSDFLNRSGK